ncbi:hypothetical protein [Halorussus caseinilyticus]|uniref:Uncharacterized protein n=1 Tax=Halorussus caseinilyticus TaxID=3034025 RepID=A0ABD5WQP6_9EURY
MSRYDEDALADGQYINAVIETMGEVSPIFEKKTREMFKEVLGDIDADEWYRLGMSPKRTADSLTK